MNITNEKTVMVFKKDNKYSVGISNKKQDGTYEKAYFPIQFNKGVELEDKTKIYIKKAWLSFYKWEYQDKKGTTFFIKCSEFETVEETIEQTKETKVQEQQRILNEVVNDPFEEYAKNNQEELNNLDFELPF